VEHEIESAAAEAAPAGLGPVAVVLAVAAGVALRAWLLTRNTGGLDADEAVVGLIARHALDGELTAFFWGQSYGGTLEALVAAVPFAALGSSTGALKGTAIVLAAVASLLTWRVGRRLTTPAAATAAALAFWIWPANYVWWSTKARGFYWTGVVLGLLLVLTCLRLREERRRVGLWLALGLVAGLGWWTTPQILFFAVPAGAWLLAVLGREAWRAVTAVPTALLGAAPWIVANVESGWASLEAPAQSVDASWLEKVWVLLHRGVPVALGLHQAEAWVSLAAPLAYVGLVAVVVGTAARRPPHALLLVVLLAYPPIWGLLPFSQSVGEGRYVLFAAPFLAVLLAHVARRPAVLRAGLVAVTALSSVGVARLEGAVLQAAPDLPLPTDLSALVDDLVEQGDGHVQADYWIAYRLAFESRERIVASPSTGPVRFEPYRDAVRSAPRVTHVFVDGSAPERAFTAALRDAGIRAERSVVDGMRVMRPARYAFWEDGVLRTR
jgi:hypothetical protein